jgi:hypothetical protein
MTYLMSCEQLHSLSIRELSVMLKWRARPLSRHGPALWSTPLELASHQGSKAIEAKIRDEISLKGGRRVKRLKVMMNRD